MRTVKNVAIAVAIVIAAFAVLFLLPNLMPGRSIHCWVKVVDQEGNGVSGYKCRIIEEGGSWPFIWRPSDATRFFETDRNGIFKYKSKGPIGRALIGYAWWDHWGFNPTHLMEQQLFVVTSYEFRKAFRENPLGYLGSKKNPLIIRVFSIGPPQRLLYWKQRVSLKNPDNYACMDLLKGRIWESDKPEGDIAMKDNLITPENINKHCLHSFNAGQNCSIYPLVDDWGLEPPLDNYKQELCFDGHWQVLRKGFAGSGQIQVYYKLKQPDNGKIIYGRLTLGLTPRVNMAELENYANLQGERNLFYEGYTDLDRDHKIQDFISPPISLPLENPLKSKPQ